MPGQVHLVMVGACAIDTILTVPHFPQQDSKLRAKSLLKRRGGNTPNSLEVLRQLVGEEFQTIITTQARERSTCRIRGESAALKLYLISTLPSQESPQTTFLTSSFGSDQDRVADGKPSVHQTLDRTGVDLSYCVYREDHTEPVSSYIISSEADSSRTIINHNALPEMTFPEFESKIENLLSATSHSELQTTDRYWFHFEGRIPETTLHCIQHLRDLLQFRPQRGALKISVEFEKPGRPGLQALAQEADVVFYSRSWAEGEGYLSAADCLLSQSSILREYWPKNGDDKKLLFCTWGKDGASSLTLANCTDASVGEEEILSSPSYMTENDRIVDTTGVQSNEKR
jgi:ketohexokinase